MSQRVGKMVFTPAIWGVAWGLPSFFERHAIIGEMFESQSHVHDRLPEALQELRCELSLDMQARPGQCHHKSNMPGKLSKVSFFGPGRNLSAEKLFNSLGQRHLSVPTRKRNSRLHEEGFEQVIEVFAGAGLGPAGLLAQSVSWYDLRHSRFERRCTD